MSKFHEIRPKTVEDVLTPAFLVDLDKAKRNSERMIKICEKLGLQLRPHMKTHKTVEFGELMTSGTRKGIAVSTLEEAEFFAQNGFDDILYAYPLIKSKLLRCKTLAESMNVFHVMIESDHGLQVLLNNPLDNGKKWSVYLEVDDGTGRTGVPCDSNDVLAIAKAASESPRIDFLGLYLYNRKPYEVSGWKNVQHAGKEGADVLTHLYKRLKDQNIECKVLSIGNTPCCSMPPESMNAVTEFHPGCYVFYDVMQHKIGVCRMDEIACRVKTCVIGHKPDLNLLLIDCGYVGLSFSGKNEEPDDFATFQGHPDLKICFFSQEISKVTTKSGEKIDFDAFPIGSELFIYPWHASATACQHPKFYIHSGNKIIDIWKPTKGW